MGWHNPPITWSQLQRAYAGEPPRQPQGDGNDSPAWTRHRERYRASAWQRSIGITDHADGNRTPRYAELHCHSCFSFLDGASQPEELVETAAGLGLDAVALTDHDGMYGVVRFAEAARELGVRTLYGAELSLDLAKPQGGLPDPEGTHLLLLAKGQEGYTRLCKSITEAQLGLDLEPGTRAEKGKPVYRLERLAEELGEHCLVLTGCRKGTVRQALSAEGPAAAARELRWLAELFGRDNVLVELTDHGLPGDSRRNDLLDGIAGELGVPTVATGAVHYATPDRGRLAAAMAAVRARRSLDELDGWLPPAPMAYLRSGAEMQQRFARYPGAVARAALIGVHCSFDLLLEAPQLPRFELPEHHDDNTYLREQVELGACRRYGDRQQQPAAYRQIEHELDVIERLGYPGYFLIVHEIVEFCRNQNILCQGRGSAANSAVCFALGITNVDAVKNGLLFERFLAPARDGPPDIDLDIEAGRREEVIQHVYARYTRRCAAQVANVITYRAKNAVRDVARALGYSPGQQDAWSKRIDRWGPLRETLEEGGSDIPEDVLELAAQIEHFPRHLGIHSGGMVLCDRPVSEICPIEWARMADRSVLQWDKDDCATAGLVKFDLLGLGMLSALHHMQDLLAEYHGETIELWQLQPTDPAVYEMLQRADSVGVFQVESRAQMATLPRLKPKEFYHLVVEVALIRPGPIQGGSVHPYIRRLNGDEEVGYEHPKLEPALKKTLGVPLFQEQLMQVAVDVADFSPAEADELRRAMGAKRSTRRMEQLKDRLYAGMASNEIHGATADGIYNKLLAFAHFGFPESHAYSFAHLVYVSAWFKLYYPAAFCAALLRAQPMGFYSPQSLVADARRHGVVVRGPDVNAGRAGATLEPDGNSAGAMAVRVGLADVRTIGAEVAERIVQARDEGGAYRDTVDLARRAGLRTAQVEALATAGAFDCLGVDRRTALWTAGAATQVRAGELPGTVVGVGAPELEPMGSLEQAAADVWATGMSPDSYPTEFFRERLHELGVTPACGLAELRAGKVVLLGGVITHRQRPATASGVTFLNIEDETGMVNVICQPALWQRYRTTASTSSALLIKGVLERSGEAISVLAKHLEPLRLHIRSSSRDFR